MNNLNKYEELQHRHLSLLHALAFAGVSAVNDDGGWCITTTELKPMPQAGVCNAFSVPSKHVMYKASATYENVPFVDDGPADHDCRHAYAARMCGCGFCKGLNREDDSHLSVPDELWADSLWSKDSKGMVNYRRYPLADAPGWVRRAHDAGVSREEGTVSTDAYSMRMIIDGKQLHASIKGHKYDNLEMTPLLNCLLTALYHAIVHAPPAKVG